MCGRFTLTTPAEQVAEALDVPDPPSLPPRYNVAPSQLVAVVGLKGDKVKRGMALLKWGLVPHWENDPKSGFKPINLRSETVRHKFGEIFRRQRCLVPVDGIYEGAVLDVHALRSRFHKVFNWFSGVRALNRHTTSWRNRANDAFGTPLNRRKCRLAWLQKFSIPLMCRVPSASSWEWLIRTCSYPSTDRVS